MNFKKAVMWVLTGILFGTFGSFIAVFLAGDAASWVVFVIFQGLAILMMLIGVIGGWLGMAKEKIGNRIEERRKEKYYKAHPEERK